MKYLLCGLGVLAVLVFYVWTKLLIVALLMLLIVDTFSTGFIAKFLSKKLSLKQYKIARYAYIIVLPIVFAMFIRTFFVDIYFVPSSSMENTLFPKDYVVVNKFSYGTKIPKMMRDIPVIGNLFWVKTKSTQNDLYRSLKPLEFFKTEDIVVFKSVVDHNKFLVKRAIGLPGDTLKVEDSRPLINGAFLYEMEDYAYDYKIANKPERSNTITTYSNKEFGELPSEAQKKLIKVRVSMGSSKNIHLFPEVMITKWTRDDYGPIVIPKAGMRITLTGENIDFYKEIISKYEGTLLENEMPLEYTFKNNYYFTMGDNRHNSIDSRYFGFVPESYIQGKVVSVFSKKRLFN